LLDMLGVPELGRHRVDEHVGGFGEGRHLLLPRLALLVRQLPRISQRDVRIDAKAELGALGAAPEDIGPTPPSGLSDEEVKAATVAMQAGLGRLNAANSQLRGCPHALPYSTRPRDPNLSPQICDPNADPNLNPNFGGSSKQSTKICTGGI
jgi:hypothetical protein